MCRLGSYRRNQKSFRTVTYPRWLCAKHHRLQILIAADVVDASQETAAATDNLQAITIAPIDAFRMKSESMRLVFGD